jgi:hypothetical protein
LRQFFALARRNRLLICGQGLQLRYDFNRILTDRFIELREQFTMMKFRSLRLFSIVVSLIFALQAKTSFAASNEFVVNPLLPSGPDPWVEYKDGYYYFMRTTATNLTIWKTRSMAELGSAEQKVVWTPPSTGPYSHDIWAPEIHFLRERWYIYVAADAETNQTS